MKVPLVVITITINPPWSEWCYPYYSPFCLRLRLLIMWDELIRSNDFGWSPLQVVLTELSSGCRYRKLGESVSMRFVVNDVGIHQITSLFILMYADLDHNNIHHTV
jgi:hypothetical protein